MPAGGGGHRSLPDLRARLKLDDSDLDRAEKAASRFSGRLGGHMDKAHTSTNKFSGSLLRLNEHIGRLGPVGATLSTRLDAIGLGSGAASAGIAGLGAAAALAAGVGIYKAAQAASALNEQMSGANVTFRTSATEVQNFSATTARSFAIARTESLSALNQFGALFTGMGAGSKDAARLSEGMVALSGDLASFRDVTPQEALESLRSGLVGEVEPLRKFGILLNEDAVANKAVEMGLVATKGELTEGAKVLARYQLILDQTKDAQGDAARTADSFANQQRRVNAELADLGTKAGTAALPAVSGLTGALEGITVGVERLSGSTGEASTESSGLVDHLRDLGKVAFDNVLPFDLLTRIAEEGRTAGFDYNQVALEQVRIEQNKRLALDQVTKAQQALNDTILAGANAGVAYERAELRTKDSIDAAAKAAADSTRPAAEKAQADLAVRDAALSQAAAAVVAAEKQRELAGGHLSAAEKAAIEQGELAKVRDMLAPDSPLRARIQGYIDDLSRVPRQVTTTITTIQEMIVRHVQQERTEARHAQDARAQLESRQFGGSVIAREAYLVGERGPELFMPDRSGRIVPNVTNNRGPYTINMSINGAGLNAEQVGDVAMRRLNRLMTLGF